MIDNSRRTGVAVEAHYRFLLWLIPVIEKFPRAHKFTVGERIERTALDVLEALIEATYTKERARHLREANLGIEKLRFLLRLAGDLRLLDRSRYEHAATWRLRQTIFRGGWFDPVQASEAWTAPCRRVLRGGSWNNNPQNLRSANRNRNTTDNRNNNIGFRLGSTLFARAGAITVAPGAH